MCGHSWQMAFFQSYFLSICDLYFNKYWTRHGSLHSGEIFQTLSWDFSFNLVKHPAIHCHIFHCGIWKGSHVEVKPRLWILPYKPRPPPQTPKGRVGRGQIPGDNEEKPANILHITGFVFQLAVCPPLYSPSYRYNTSPIYEPRRTRLKVPHLVPHRNSYPHFDSDLLRIMLSLEGSLPGFIIYPSPLLFMPSLPPQF